VRAIGDGQSSPILYLTLTLPRVRWKQARAIGHDQSSRILLPDTDTGTDTSSCPVKTGESDRGRSILADSLPDTDTGTDTSPWLVKQVRAIGDGQSSWIVLPDTDTGTDTFLRHFLVASALGSAYTDGTHKMGAYWFRLKV
jgi:hypothetical protein